MKYDYESNQDTIKYLAFKMVYFENINKKRIRDY